MNWTKRTELVKSTFIEFFKEKSLLHGAALAYYSLLALVPVLYLSITYFGKIVGHDVMLEIISTALEERVGIADASGVVGFIDEVNLKSGNTFLELFGIFALLFSCTVIFNSLKTSINEFYDIAINKLGTKKKIVRNVVSRLISLLFIIGLATLLVVLYFAQTLFLSLNDFFFENSETGSLIFSTFIKHGIAISTNMIVFSFIFKYLNDGKVSWRIAIQGSLLTGVLLYIGQVIIKYYIANYFFASGSGIAGTILVLLVWVYYSSQIIFFGAKFIAVLSRMKGIPIVSRD